MSLLPSVVPSIGLEPRGVVVHHEHGPWAWTWLTVAIRRRCEPSHEWLYGELIRRDTYLWHRHGVVVQRMARPVPLPVSVSVLGDRLTSGASAQAPSFTEGLADLRLDA